MNTDTKILNEIGEALESRGFVHMTNGKSIGELLDRLEVCETLLSEVLGHVYQEGTPDAECNCEPAHKDEESRDIPEFICLPCRIRNLLK